MKIKFLYYFLFILFVVLNVGTHVYLKDAALNYYNIDEHLIEREQLSEEQIDNMTYSFRNILSLLAMFVTLTMAIVAYLYRNELIKGKAHIGRRLLVGVVLIISTLLSIIYAVGFYY